MLALTCLGAAFVAVFAGVRTCDVLWQLARVIVQGGGRVWGSRNGARDGGGEGRPSDGREGRHGVPDAHAGRDHRRRSGVYWSCQPRLLAVSVFAGNESELSMTS